MPSLNPFPDLPVSRLDSDAFNQFPTVPTEAVERARTLVGDWIDRYDENSPKTPLIVSVRGDFGSGKTHLLVDARYTLEGKARDRGLPLTVIAAAAGSSSPKDWYRESLGPQIAASSMQNCATRLYGMAARRVADRAKLTKSVGSELTLRPEFAKDLVRSELLNPTAVEHEYEQLVEETFHPFDESIRTAIRSLAIYDSKSAARWWSGMELSPEAAESLKLPQKIATDADALNAIVSAAALHWAVKRPFCVIVDELEHLTDRGSEDQKARSSAWLKRVVEGLAEFGAASIFAGQWGAWHTTQDLSERFPPQSTIQLVRLTSNDVIALAHSRIGDLGNLDRTAAAEIVASSAGNMRQALGILHVLFDETDGFSGPIHRDTILAIAVRQSNRMSEEEVATAAVSALELAHFQVRSNPILGPGLPFALVAERTASALVVIDLAPAGYDSRTNDLLTKFVARRNELQEYLGSSVVGCFVSYGSLDLDTQRLIANTGDETILTFDGTDANFSESLSKVVDAVAARYGGRSLDSKWVNQRGRMGQGTALESGLQSLQIRRQQEIDEIASKRSELASPEESARESALDIPPEELRDRFSLAYQEFTKEPSRGTVLSALLTGPAGRLFALVVVASTLIFFALPPFLLALEYDPSEAFASLVTVVCRSFAGIFFFTGISYLLVSYLRIERFFQYRDRVLRKIYLTDSSITRLTDANDHLMRLFEQHGSNWSRFVDREPY